MGSDRSNQIPIINLSNTNFPQLERGTKEWQDLSKRVIEACENYGCFEVVYDKMSKELKEKTFSLIRQLFELPLETKLKNNDPRPYSSYAGPHPVQPLYEGFGLGDASSYDSIKEFAELVWPHDIDQFWTFISMLKPVGDLHETIVRLIIDGYGLGEKMDRVMPCKTLVRVMKYKAPSPENINTKANGLYEHTDKTMNTLIYEDGVSGLEIETKDGHWITLTLSSPDSFIFIAGDPLMAWSNGRIHATKHRVTMRGDKDRYSFAAFLIPVDGTVIKPPKDLIDEKHPQFFKEFNYSDFLKFANTEGVNIESAKHIYLFAGN